MLILDSITKFILSFLDSICTIYISSYSMENINQLFIYANLYMVFRATDSNLSLSLLSSRWLPSPPSQLPPFLTPTSASSSPYSTYIMAHEQSKSPSLLILLQVSPSSTYPIKTFSNSHQQTTYLGSFRLKLSS